MFPLIYSKPSYARTYERDSISQVMRNCRMTKVSVLVQNLQYMCMIKSKRMLWAGHVARTGQRRSAYKVLVGKPEEKILIGAIPLCFNNATIYC
jgi:hypothetical protein